MIVALFLHILADLVWVGGMFLAYMVVRPAAAEALEPSQRLKLWNGIFRRFFPWMWTAVVLLLATGFIMMSMMDRVPQYVIVMTLIGIVMAAIFVYLYFVLFAQLKRTVAAEEWQAAGAALATIRKVVATNLTLGLVNIAVAVLGRSF